MFDGMTCVGVLLLTTLLGPGPKPGQYAITLSSVQDGKPLPQQSTSVCHTQADFDHPDRELPKKMSGGCPVEGLKLNKDTMTWRATCPPTNGGQLTATYTLVFDNDGHSAGKTIEVEIKATRTSATCDSKVHP
jgi:hypothetical protein